jgi:hypothetical protein
MGRSCGPCRECCIVLTIDEVQTKADSPCQHLCAKGCGIYEDRPHPCQIFECAWKRGLMGPNDRPDKSHMVIWPTQMLGPSGKPLNVMQCNHRKGAKRHKKTMKYLMALSYQLPVPIIQDSESELFSHAQSVIRWRQGVFVKLSHGPNGQITRGEVVDNVAYQPESRGTGSDPHLAGGDGHADR